MRFGFETKANKAFAEKQAAKAIEVGKDIMPTPFPMDYEIVEKDIYQQLEELDMELSFKKKNVKNKFAIVTEVCAMNSVNLSRGALLIQMYIIANLDYNSNYIEITEDNFKQFTGLSRSIFYESLNELVRPEVEYIASGDNLKLLARTTKKSIYIVNHNMIFKGKLDKFVEIYREKYGEGCELDSKGKVIIRN